MALLSQCIVEIDYNSGTLPVYVGYALPGAATSAAAWMIKKITYDGNNNPLTVTYAGGGSGKSTDFSQIWDNRASLSYA